MKQEKNGKNTRGGERERETRESDRQKERDGQRKGREWEMNERQETDLLAGYQEIMDESLNSR